MNEHELICRAVNLDAIEFEGGDGRTLHARLFSWDSVSQVSDGGPRTYHETWDRGVFSQSIKRAQSTGRGWPLMYNHDLHSLPIGMVPMIHERNDGPWMTAKISRTSLGDDVIELIKDGVLPGVSVNGRNIRSARDGRGNIRRMEVALQEVSVTPFPALVGADAMVLRNMAASMTTHSIDIQTDIQPRQPEKRQKLSDYLAQLEPLPGTEVEEK